MATVALSGIITPTNVVTATSTTTLTNKTLTAPTIASANLTTALTLTGASGTNGQVLTSGGSAAAPTWTTVGGGTPAGSNTQIQFNNAGAFGANASFSFDGTNFVLDGSTKIYVLGSGAKIQMQTPTASANWTFETAGTNLTIASPQSGQFNIYRGSANSTFGVGAADPSSSGAGITFPATQSASSNANTLDDYEEGTWTPTLGGTATYSFQGGLYTKIGRSVTTQGWLIVSSIGTGSTNDVSGLPFTCVSQQVGTGGSVGYFENLNNNIVFITPEVQPNTTSFVFNTLAAAGATASYNTSLWKNSTRLSFVNTYFV